tara:strand:+ start:198 stop:1352 length:1155 start_codon:yes stop_codon:yes gene_type:complete
MDYAATTSVREEVLLAMKPYFTIDYANPSSLYDFASESRNAIEYSRQHIAEILNSRRSEIIFTSGGTESNNMAIKGVALNKLTPGHMITSSTEHHAVLSCTDQLKKLGWDITVLDVKSDGTVDPKLVIDSLTNETELVSLMYVNNETGAINDIKTISKGIKTFSKKNKRTILFHTDAVQATGKLKLDVKDLNVDMLTISAHKIHGPKGIGLLYVKRGTELAPLISGGGQENNFRSGTENVPSIVGLGEAIILAENERKSLYKTMQKFQLKLLKGIKNISGSYKLNGDLNYKVPSIINFSFPNIQGEPLILGLDFKGILASSGSACSSASVEPSHVLTSMGLSRNDAVGSLRLSMGRKTTENDIELTLIALENVLKQLNSMSTNQ